MGTTLSMLVIGLTWGKVHLNTVTQFPGSFPRPKQINLPVDYREYAPTAGIKELREAVANYYNEEYRQGKASKRTETYVLYQEEEQG